MNIIMSRAVQHHHPFRGLSPMQLQQQEALSRIHSPSTPNSPQSPLDFTDRIPLNEIRLSSETLGSGSFGTVFKGRWQGRDVAVKQFKTRDEIDSFLVEVKQLSRVKHPNIVSLYGAATSVDLAYLVMEYAEGGSLNHLLHVSKHQDYDLRHACSWAMQTARGVAYLHSIRPKPIMHRDLKPANLLLFSRGKILKICDFGTACAVKTQMTNNTGSASYMAPEVFSTSSYLESGDVFSWSIIFWEILVRSLPYPQLYSGPYQILWSVNQGTRPAEIEGCPKPIWYLITRSWDKNPKKRPSMLQVAQEMKLIFSLTEKRSAIDGASATGSNRNSRGEINDDRINESRTNTTALPTDPPMDQSQNDVTSHSRQSLPSIRSPFEKLSTARMTTSDQMFEIRQHHHHNISVSTSSTSSSQRYRQHHYQNNPLGEQHFEQFNQRLTRQKEQFKHSKALQRHVESLRGQFKHLEDALDCDRKNTASVSFQEFEGLKGRIKALRKSVKLNSEQHNTSVARAESSSLADPSPPSEHRSPPEQSHAQRPSELKLH